VSSQGHHTSSDTDGINIQGIEAADNAALAEVLADDGDGKVHVHFFLVQVSILMPASKAAAATAKIAKGAQSTLLTLLAPAETAAASAAATDAAKAGAKANGKGKGKAAKKGKAKKAKAAKGN
jgi:hypothetical protein